MTASQKGLGWAIGALAVAMLLLAFSWYQKEFRQTSLMAYVPSVGGSLVRLRVDLLREAGLLGAGKIPKEGDYQEFVAATGFDFERDLDEALLWLSAKENYYVARGRFDWPKLRAYAAANGGRCVDRVCSLPASQAGKSLSFFPLGEEVIGVALSVDPYAAALLKRRQEVAALPCSAEAPAALLLRPVELLQWMPQAAALKELERAEICVEATKAAATARLQLVLPSEDQAARLAPAFQDLVQRMGGMATPTEGKRVRAQWAFTAQTLAALFAGGERP